MSGRNPSHIFQESLFHKNTKYWTAQTRRSIGTVIRGASINGFSVCPSLFLVLCLSVTFFLDSQMPISQQLGELQSWNLKYKLAGWNYFWTMAPLWQWTGHIAFLWFRSGPQRWPLPLVNCNLWSEIILLTNGGKVRVSKGFLRESRMNGMAGQRPAPQEVGAGACHSFPIPITEENLYLPVIG